MPTRRSQGPGGSRRSRSAFSTPHRIPARHRRTDGRDLSFHPPARGERHRAGSISRRSGTSRRAGAAHSGAHDLLQRRRRGELVLRHERLRARALPRPRCAAGAAIVDGVLDPAVLPHLPAARLERPSLCRRDVDRLQRMAEALRRPASDAARHPGQPDLGRQRGQRGDLVARASSCSPFRSSSPRTSSRAAGVPG